MYEEMQPRKNHQTIKLSKLCLTSMKVRENFLFTRYCISVKIKAILYVCLQYQIRLIGKTLFMLCL